LNYSFITFSRSPLLYRCLRRRRRKKCWKSYVPELTASAP